MITKSQQRINLEQLTIEAVEQMCIESLDPESFEAWERIKNNLYEVRGLDLI